jgi:hypothetical protein
MPEPSPWQLVDQGPPELMGTPESFAAGHYVGREHEDPDEAVREAVRRANSTGHVFRVVRTIWPVRQEEPDSEP